MAFHYFACENNPFLCLDNDAFYCIFLFFRVVNRELLVLKIWNDILSKIKNSFVLIHMRKQNKKIKRACFVLVKGCLWIIHYVDQFSSVAETVI
mmetsp:Transcript_6175/g.8095  ORF Transcript_6175/g.8095 Transcript_6175/m.8095 type:complete len:94 (-) Transcript_6175:302-583(-)